MLLNYVTRYKDLQVVLTGHPDWVLVQASPSPVPKLVGPASIRKARCQDPSIRVTGGWQALAPKFFPKGKRSYFSFLLRGLGVLQNLLAPT